MREKKRWAIVLGSLFLMMALLAGAAGCGVPEASGINVSEGESSVVLEEADEDAKGETESEEPLSVESWEEVADTSSSVTAEEKEPPLPVLDEMETAMLEEVATSFAFCNKQNPDVYAWIIIPGTAIDYPVLHTLSGDIDYYLTHTIDDKEGLPGSIYTQSVYNMDFSRDPVTVVLGHNMSNGTMFGSLKYYQEEAYRKSHPYIYIYTPERVYRYRIVFATTHEGIHLMNTYDRCKTPELYEAFLQDYRTNFEEPSWFEEPFEVTTDDRMLVLVTCTVEEEMRFWIGAVME